MEERPFRICGFVTTKFYFIYRILGELSPDDYCTAEQIHRDMAQAI